MDDESGRATKAGVKAKNGMIVAAITLVIVVSGVGAWYVLGDSSGDANTVPTCDLVWDTESGLRFIIGDPMLDTVSWSDVDIRMDATPIDFDPYELAYWRWYPTQENLTSQDGQPTTYPMQDYWGIPTDVQMYCNLTDISGDGYVGDGDFFTLTPMIDYADVTGIPCCLRVIYRPMGDPMCSLEFIP
jgi:hypothetical protein